MSQSNVIELSKYKSQHKLHAYQSKIDKMDKGDLLEEMINFQHKRTEAGMFTKELISEGLILFNRNGCSTGFYFKESELEPVDCPEDF